MRVAVVAVLAGWLFVVWGWAPAPYALTVDDSFYYLRIAENVARGLGPTFDGIAPTNGYHPLWLPLLVPLAKGFDGETLVRVVLTLQLGLVALGAVLMGRRASFALAALSAIFYVTKVYVNGLESALELAMIAFGIFAARRAIREPSRRSHLVLVGLAGTLATLARLSAVVFAILLLVVVASRTWRSRGARVLSDAALAALVFGSPIAVWVLTSFVKIGHVIPISAAIKLGGEQNPPRIVLGLAALAGLGILVRAEARAKLPVWALPLGGYALVQTAANALLRGFALPEIWYLVPHVTCAALLLARIRKPRAKQIAFGVVGVLAVLSWRARLDPATYATYLAARNTGTWIDANLPRDARLAGWDAGIVAYGAGPRVFFPLDGLVGSWRYKESYLDRGRVGAFLDEERVDYVVQYFDASSPLAHSGIDFSTWTIVHEERATFAGVFGRSAEPRAHRFLVLARRR